MNNASHREGAKDIDVPAHINAVRNSAYKPLNQL